MRLTQDSKLYFYTFLYLKNGTILDISPTGMQLSASTKPGKDQIIKFDGEDFKAVGIVSYQDHDAEADNEIQQVAGIKFLTVNFAKRKGQFLSESA